MAVTYILEQGSSATGPWVAVSGSPFSTTSDVVDRAGFQHHLLFPYHRPGRGPGADSAAIDCWSYHHWRQRRVETPEATNITTVGPTISASTVPGTAAPSGPFTTFALNASGNVLRNGIVDVGPGGGATSPTWLASTAVGAVTVSGQTLTLTGGTGNIRVNMATPTAGVNWYVEINATHSSPYEGFGIVMPSWLTNDTNDTPGDFGDSVAIVGDQTNGHALWFNSVGIGNTAALTGIVGIAYNASLNTVWFSVNGSYNVTSTGANPVTGVGGIVMTSMTPPYSIGFGDFGHPSNLDSVVLNAGQSAFSFQPTGYPAPTIAGAPTATSRLFYHNHTTYQEIAGLATTFGQPGWFSDNGSPGAWSPANSPLPANETILISNIPAQTANTVFTVQGVLGNYLSALSPPNLQYQDNSGTWQALPGGSSVSQTAFSFSHPGVASASSMTVSVRDLDNQTISATSNTFIVQSGVVTPGAALFVSSVNKRYMATGSPTGPCVWLCASHTWTDLQIETPNTMTWQLWIDNQVMPELVTGQNTAGLLRVWIWSSTFSDGTLPDSQIPYNRSSTGGALAGGNKFDLTSYNSAFFNQLIALVTYCSSRNIYCQVQFFDGRFTQVDKNGGNWDLYNSANNINGTGVTGFSETDTSSATCTTLQKAFIAHLVTLLYGFTNVTYEIINEVHATSGSLSFVNQMIAQVRATETSLGGIKHRVSQGAAASWDGSSWGGSNSTFNVTTADYLLPVGATFHLISRFLGLG